MNRDSEIERIAKLLHKIREAWCFATCDEYVARDWETTSEPHRAEFRDLAVQFLPQVNQDLEIERIARLLHEIREEWTFDFSDEHIVRSWETISESRRAEFRDLTAQFLPQESPSTPVRVEVVYPWDVSCPTCGAVKRRPCIDVFHHMSMPTFHPSRIQAALDKSKGSTQEKPSKSRVPSFAEREGGIEHCPVCGKPSDHAVIKTTIGGKTEYLCFSPWREGEPTEDVDEALVWKGNEAVVAWKVGCNWSYNDEYTPEPWTPGWSWKPLPPPPTLDEEE